MQIHNEKYAETNRAYWLGQVLRRYKTWIEEVGQEQKSGTGKTGPQTRHFVSHIRNQLRVHFYKDGFDHQYLEKIDFLTGIVLLASYEWADKIQTDRYLSFKQAGSMKIEEQERSLKASREKLIREIFSNGHFRPSLYVFLETLILQLRQLNQAFYPGDFEIGSSYLCQLGLPFLPQREKDRVNQ